MKNLFGGLLIVLAFTGCQRDETIAGQTTPQTVWTLQSINDTAVEPTFTIQFGPDGEVFGQADCNRYTSRQLTPMPWFDLGPIAGSRALCPNADLETQYYQALDRAETVEIAGDTLLISGPETTLTFKSGG